MKDNKAIIETLRSLDHEEMMEEYKIRQKENQEKNLSIVKKINEILGIASEFSIFDETVNMSIAIATARKSNDYKITLELKNLLNLFDYNYAQEILVASQNIDQLQTKDYPLEIFNILIRSFLSIDSITKNDTTFTLDTCFGPITITNPISNTSPNLRRCFCHNLTSNFLLNHPNYYGAYYYIPLQFQGYLEHSVVIDTYSNQVLDLANNNAFDLATWQKLYPNCSFIISGKDFQNIYYDVLNKLNISIQMATLEEIKLVRKRQNKG